MPTELPERESERLARAEAEGHLHGAILGAGGSGAIFSLLTILVYWADIEELQPIRMIFLLTFAIIGFMACLDARMHKHSRDL